MLRTNVAGAAVLLLAGVIAVGPVVAQDKVVAQTPPMGWNSWDAFGESVKESDVRATAEWMAKNLKEYGWQYVVVDM